MHSTKDQILALLETRRGSYISGQAIAAQLNISRNAVWKAIKTLQQEGHSITAGTNKGYSLCEHSDALSASAMQALAPQATFRIYPSVESTNKTAKELALAGAEHGTVIVANKQTAGRGRYDRGFCSPAGQVYFSIVLHPQALWLNTPTLITSFAAVAVCEAIEMLCNKRPQIKWVNDVFLGKKKICGILTEAVTDFESGQIGWIVVGIGVNFTAEFPQALQEIATSIFAGEAPVTTRNCLIAEIVNRMLVFRDETALLREYKQRLMMLGRQVQVRGAGEPYTAIALDIDAAARLIVRTETGEVQVLSSGEVSIVT